MNGSKGKGTTIETDDGEYDPDTTTTISRGVGKCPNCSSVIEYDYIINQGGTVGLGHQLYAVAYKEGEGGLQFRIPNKLDFEGLEKANSYIESNLERWNLEGLNPDIEVPYGHMTAERCAMIQKGLDTWDKLFNPRQLLTLVTYVEIINEAKSKLQMKYEPEKVKAIATYLALVLDRCVDKNARLCIWDSGRSHAQRATTQHALNLTWNYPEFCGSRELWEACADAVISDYQGLCNLFGTKSQLTTIPGLEQHDRKSIQISTASADSLFHIPDNSVDAIVTDPPYYSTIQYAELADFFYVWQKRTLGDIFPDLFWSELTDKDREMRLKPR